MTSNSLYLGSLMTTSSTSSTTTTNVREGTSTLLRTAQVILDELCNGLRGGQGTWPAEYVLRELVHGDFRDLPENKHHCLKEMCRLIQELEHKLEE